MESVSCRPPRLAALAETLTDPRWRDAMTTSSRTDVLAMFSTSRGGLVRVYSQKPRLADVEFAVELALYGMFCLDSPQYGSGPPIAPSRMSASRERSA
jgi:hypothetical protein